MSRFIVISVLLLSSIQAMSQLPGLHIKKAEGRIVLDAEMNEPDWQTAEVAGRFKQLFPFDSSYAWAQTEVRMTYDDHFIYLFATMFNESNTRKYVTPSLRRDYR